MALSAGTGVLVPVFQMDETKHRRAIANWSQEVNQGHINNNGTVTLISGTAATAVADPRVGINSVIVLMPKTATAASALPACYITTASQAFTITHANNGDGDRTYGYAVLGV